MLIKKFAIVEYKLLNLKIFWPFKFESVYFDLKVTLYITPMSRELLPTTEM